MLAHLLPILAESALQDNLPTIIVGAIAAVVGAFFHWLTSKGERKARKSQDDATTAKTEAETSRATAETFKTTFEGVDTAVNSLLRLVAETQARLDAQGKINESLEKKLDHQDAVITQLREDSKELRAQLRESNAISKRQAAALDTLVAQLRALGQEPKIPIPFV